MVHHVEVGRKTRGKITPRAIVCLFIVLAVVAILATGIGLTKGHALAAGPDKTHTADAATSSEAATTTPTPSINFEEPVTLGIDSGDNVEKA